MYFCTPKKQLAMSSRIQKIALIIIVLFVGLGAFAQNQSTVSVNIRNNTFKHVDLINAYGNGKTAYASADIKNDAFSMKLDVPNDIYRFDFGEENYFLIVITPGENMELIIDAEDLQNVVSVTNSPSMAFVQDVSSANNYKKEVIDSLNNALQKDEAQKYWSKMTQEVTNFRQTTNEIDNYVMNAFGNVDSIAELISDLAPKGKVKGGDVETFASMALTYLKGLDNNYRPFQNFMESKTLFYDFNTNRLAGNKDYYAILDNYLTETDNRQTDAQSELGSSWEKAKLLISERDSLAYESLFDKKSNKSAWVNHVVSAFPVATLQAIAKSKAEYNASMNVQKSVGANAVSGAQQLVKAVVNKYQTAYNETDAAISNQIKQAILDNKDDIATLMFLDLFPKEQNAALHESVINALYKKYPTHPIVKERYMVMNSPSGRTGIGSMAPELAFPDPDGNIRKLSDLRGKVVLIDFWASWCGPCRRESPNVRNVYQKYHDKGFEVFSVSLDRDANSWKKAIKDDQLVWPNHVSDLKYWSSEAAAIYGVRSIPAMFLLDREGRIVAKDLRGAALENAVREMINK